jgi:mannose-1-phosphate guanylyltransferase/mannose-6-phosphate isomerase
MPIYPVIMCGGGGTRLWPASSARLPKQFLNLVGSQSIFQETATRVSGVEDFAQLVIIANHRHADLIEAQLSAVGLTAALVLEPVARDSGPAIAAAAAWIAKSDPAGVAVVVAADHHLPDAESFRAAVGVAAAAARKGRIVTFGVAPREASTAYGYIRPAHGEGPVLPVAAFVEKPAAADALAYVNAGYLWNSGNFVATAETLLAAFDAHSPEVSTIVREAVAMAEVSPGRSTLSHLFATAPNISFDYAVMEKTPLAAVLPVSFDWSDLGAWSAVWAVSPKDDAGNAVLGDAITIGTTDCLIRTDGPHLATIGIRGLAVVVENGSVLVCDLAHDQHTKAVHSEVQVRDHKNAASRKAKAPPAPTLSQTSEKLTRWLFNEALPIWWCFGADHAVGGFHERLTWDLSPTDHPRRLRVQARQVFVYATAGVMGWTGPWPAAVRHGLDWLEARHRRPDGLYRTQVDRDGAVLDDSANLYDQAFVLLALATAAKALPDEQAALSAKAHALADRITAAFAHDQGGFRAGESSMRFEADPLMHLFEASQAWLDVEPSPVFRDLAGSIATHFIDRMMDRDQPRIREVFAADWSPAPGEPGRRVWPGHQFEWAWLLDRWGLRQGDDRARQVAAGLYLTGRRGVDPASGFVLHELLDDDTPTSANGRLWSQAERLRAALALETDPAARAQTVAAAADALEAYFTPSPAGLWRDARPDLGLTEDAAMASSLYHIVGAILALHKDAARDAL